MFELSIFSFVLEALAPLNFEDTGFIFDFENQDLVWFLCVEYINVHTLIICLFSL